MKRLATGPVPLVPQHFRQFAQDFTRVAAQVFGEQHEAVLIPSETGLTEKQTAWLNHAMKRAFAKGGHRLVWANAAPRNGLALTFGFIVERGACASCETPFVDLLANTHLVRDGVSVENDGKATIVAPLVCPKCRSPMDTTPASEADALASIDAF